MVTANPNPTVAGTVRDLTMVAMDPLATNPVLNAMDTPATAGTIETAGGGIPAWVLIPVALLGGWWLFR